jgi:putative restriction endonuclease
MVSSEGEAERLILSILPEPDTRQKVLSVFADAIEEANRHGRDVWAVRYNRARKVRLHVGGVIICTIGNGRIWMALDKGLLETSNDRSLLERSGDWKWGKGRNAEYRLISSRNGIYLPSEKHPELWPVIRRLHFESIYKAANQTTLDPRTRKRHSPELLSYIGKELGRQLPDPLYEPRGGKEQPAKSVIGDASLSSDDLVPGRVFSYIPGYPEGSRFESRAELSEAGVHRPTVAGISGSEREGADSIVLSGGYEDDQDFGDVIVYTGHGGRDPETGRQVADQNFSRGNRALAHSSLHGLPVRVIRGWGHNSPYSPSTGYRYDGLYLVDDYWHEPGRSGFRVWRYRLIKLPDQPDVERPDTESAEAPSAPPRQETTVQRIVRDTKQARRIKELYDYSCQMCGTRLEGLSGPYAEAAHVRPLGVPHHGPDTPDNILCLCPNHHVLLDHGGVGIGEDFSLAGEEGKLTVHPQHRISEEHLRYRREHYDTNG